MTIINWKQVKIKMLTNNWPKLSELNTEGVDRNIREIIKDIQDILASCSKQVKKKTGKTFTLSEDLKEWVKIRRKLNKLRMLHTLPEDTLKLIKNMSNRCNRRVRRMLKDEAEVFEESTTDKIAQEKDTSKRWRLFEAFLESQREPAQKSGILDDQGNMKTMDKDIAEVHASRLEKTHADANDPNFMDDWKEAVEEEVERREDEISPNQQPDPYVLLEDPVTPEELITQLQNVKNNKAPGMDGITNKVIKMGGMGLVMQLCLLFTLTLSLGYFPEDWKTGIVIMIAKAGKNPRLSKSFRPITLLACLSKLLEAVVLARLQKAQ